MALGQAAQAVQRAHIPTDVYRTMGDELAGLGYRAVIYTPARDPAYLAPAYSNLDPVRLQQAQGLLGFWLAGTGLALTPDDLCEPALSDERPRSLGNPIEPTEDDISVVVGYLHKVVPTSGVSITPRDLLFSCLISDIPVVLVAERAFHEAARERLGEVRDRVKLVDPADLYEAILQVVPVAL